MLFATLGGNDIFDIFFNEANSHQPNYFSANIYPFKVNNRDTIKRFEKSSKLTIKTTEQRHDIVLMFFLLILNIFHTFFLYFYC